MEEASINHTLHSFILDTTYIVEDSMFLLQRHFVRLDWLVHLEQYHKGTKCTILL